MKTHFKSLILLILSTSHSWSGVYTIQLEASKAPDLADYQSLTMYGKPYNLPAENGVIRTRLGTFTDKNVALDTLDKIHAAGYTDAFLTNKHSTLQTRTADLTFDDTYPDETFDLTKIKGWDRLTIKQQANVVFLDGRLHIKNSDTFTPLESILQP